VKIARVLVASGLLAFGWSFHPRHLWARHPADKLEKLGVFVGHWKTTGEMKETAYSHARVKSSDEMTCNWSTNHAFLICDQLIHAADGLRNDLSIYTYNDRERVYAFFGLSRNDAQARTTKLTIEDDLWTYWDEDDDAGKHIRFRTTNKFVSPTTMMWRSEYSQDGTRWILMGEGIDTRIN
jgi:hypothetical protein